MANSAMAPRAEFREPGRFVTQLGARARARGASSTGATASVVGGGA